MHHDTPLIATIAVGLVLAFVFGALATRVRVSPIVGYLLAGIAVGPHTPGFVADAKLSQEISEIGVILLMFGVGLHFSLKDLLAVKGIAVPGALVQIGVATLLGWGLANALGWSLGAGLVFGLALSVASTVVLLRALEQRQILDTQRGRIAVGWLLVTHPFAVLATLLVVVVGKSVAALLIVRLFGHPTSTALTIAASLAQIGEFSFILASLGVTLGLLPQLGSDLLLAGAILSIMLNPVIFALVDRKRDTDSEAASSGHAILIGYGRVGRLVARQLQEAGTPFVVIEDSLPRVHELRREGVRAVYGNGASMEVLEAAHVKDARWLLIAIPNGLEAGQIAVHGRERNPGLDIIARAHFDAEVDHLVEHGVDLVIMGEREIARGMIARVGLEPAA